MKVIRSAQFSWLYFAFQVYVSYQLVMSGLGLFALLHVMIYLSDLLRAVKCYLLDRKEEA